MTRSTSRRRFVKRASIASLSALFGGEIVFAKHMPKGLIPVCLTNPTDWFQIEGKHPEMRVLNDRPLNMETPAHLLDEPFTPVDRLFVRNNGIPPVDLDVDQWTLSIDGESVVQPKVFTLDELRNSFEHHSLALTIECGGNGRSEFNPQAKGNQWTIGAVGCPEWTGVLLKDALNAAGLKDDAVYIGYYGKDTHLSNDPNKHPISRGVPINKALEDESLIAWSVNGEDLPLQHGYPLRLVFGGWPASTSGKWLSRIVVRDRIHDGEKMGGQSYRVPCSPVAPGAKVADEDMCIIESMPVKSLITYPKSGAMIKIGRPLEIRGHAWAGDHEVKQMDYSIDFGESWQGCELKSPINRLAWQQWRAVVDFPGKGYYEVWARATDENGKTQPMLVPGWNPKGYLNNACHRIAVKVSS